MVVRRGAALALLVVLVAGCTADPESTGRGSQAVPAPGGGAPASPEPGLPYPSAAVPAPPPLVEPGDQHVALPVYYVAETAAGFRLQREFHSVWTNDPGSAAVREMLAGPVGTDPDYRTHWPPGTALRTPVTRRADVIVVDLTGIGSAQVGPQLAALTVQQLVFTVQGALQSTEPVRILVDGRQVPQLWGAVDISAPVERGDPYALRSLVQIDAPAHGAVVGREIEVSGEAAVFEATVPWEVLRDGERVRAGFTSTSEGQRFAPFVFTLELEPGEYTIRVLEDDPSDGEGRPVLTDDKTFTVAA
jgi:hypothetical protein